MPVGDAQRRLRASLASVQYRTERGSAGSWRWREEVGCPQLSPMSLGSGATALGSAIRARFCKNNKTAQHHVGRSHRFERG
jgi:hypothetical protein